MGVWKRKKVVEDYLKTLGISKTNDIEKELKKKLGPEVAEPIIEKWNKINPAKIDTGTVHRAGLHVGEDSNFSADRTELYDFMNQNYTTSMIFNSGSDADIYLETCNWIIEHRSAFNGSILDIGCGTGIVTCFIALMFPEWNVTGVDRSQNSIAIANELKEKLRLKNVTFIYDVLGDSVGNRFNTVFSSRTVHENIGIKRTRYKFLAFSEQIAAYQTLYFKYVETISKRIVDGGRFISFERFNSCDTDYYGFLKVLNLYGLKTDFGFYKIIEAKESNLVSKSKFTITVAEKTKCWSEEELFHNWSQHAFAHTRSITRFTKPQVDYYIQENAGNVRFGFISYDVNPDAQTLRCVVYDLKNDQNRFLMHQKNSQVSQLNIYDNSDEAEARMLFENMKRVDRKNGFTVVEIKPGSKY